MTTIKFYSGMRTIGGTVIAIESDGHRLMFDFGYVVKPVFDEHLKPRNLTDKLRMQMLPGVDGIFSKSELQHYPLVPYEDSDLTTCFFISHMHLDHMSSLEHIASDIPIHMSNISMNVYNALCDIGEQKTIHNLVGKAFDEPFDFGPFTLTIIPVDHDVPGASGLKVETPDGTITYTGDLRFHGHDTTLSHEFIQKVKNTDVLISEGVTISFIDEDRVLIPNPDIPEGGRTESLLKADFTEILNEYEGVVFFNIYHRNIYRVLNLIDVANENNRIAVLESQTANLISHFTNRQDFMVIRYEKDGPDATLGFDTISTDVIRKEPGRYLMQVSYNNTMELLDLDLEKAVYVHSNGTPLGDYDPAYGRLTLLLEIVNLPFVSLACGGHAHPDQLKYMVESIRPKTLVPYHSFAPQFLTNDTGACVLPEPGDTYVLESGKLVKSNI